MKLRLKNEFGAPINLLEADSVRVYFPREDGGFLEKRDFSITDAQKGEMTVSLGSFEAAALKVGDKQDFFAKVVVGDEVLTLRFAKGLCVEMKDGKKEINEKLSPI